MRLLVFFKINQYVMSYFTNFFLLSCINCQWKVNICLLLRRLHLLYIFVLWYLSRHSFEAPPCDVTQTLKQRRLETFMSETPTLIKQMQLKKTWSEKKICLMAIKGNLGYIAFGHLTLKREVFIKIWWGEKWVGYRKSSVSTLQKVKNFTSRYFGQQFSIWSEYTLSRRTAQKFSLRLNPSKAWLFNHLCNVRHVIVAAPLGIFNTGSPRYMRCFYLRFCVYAIQKWPLFWNLFSDLQ